MTDESTSGLSVGANPAELDLWVPDPSVLDGWASDAFGLDEESERRRLRKDAWDRPTMLRNLKEARSGPIRVNGEQDASRFIANRPTDRVDLRRQPGLTRLGWAVLDVLSAFHSVTKTELITATASSASSLANILSKLDHENLITKLDGGFGGKTVYGVTRTGRSLLGIDQPAPDDTNVQRDVLVAGALLDRMKYWPDSVAITWWDISDGIQSQHKSAQQLRDVFCVDATLGLLAPQAAVFQDHANDDVVGEVYVYVDDPGALDQALLSGLATRHRIIKIHLVLADRALADLSWWPEQQRFDRRPILHLPDPT